LFFNKEDVEKQLLQGSFSFCYLREDKLRTIDAFSSSGDHIQFKDFLNHFGIDIHSKNLFKTGKYLSRVFRPIKYGSFFRELDVQINTNHSGKITDGISLISVDLAKSLGWENAQPDMSAQLTLFFNGGLIKGHCVLSDKITHDIIIYGKENIKTEISLNNGYEYVTLEPVKLGESLRMDIQSMLNLWQLFGPEQFLLWSYSGMNKFKEDLFAGKLSKWLDNFDEIDKDEYDQEQWTLRKAIWAKVDYTKYPGLIRLAWSMMKNSIMRYADNIHGLPAFRIPVIEGKRAYLRVDLRDHDIDGNFLPTVDEGTVELDKYGNLWINQEDVIEFMAVKGGSDMDDSIAIIPIEDGKAVIYRNPNQYSEYGIHKIISSDVELKHQYKLIGEVPIKEIIEEKAKLAGDLFYSKNSILNNFLQTLEPLQEYFIDYSLPNLIRTYTKIAENTASIGVAANAEMIRSAIGITKPKLLMKLMKQFNWNLERIIDATVKDGIDYGDYIEQLTYLLFLKMADEKDVHIPDGYGWDSLKDKSATALTDHYTEILRKLREEKGMLGDIFAQSMPRFNNPVNLKRLITLIDEVEWTELGVDVKGEAFEGLLEKAASEGKKGAGQYFTPRVLIQSIVRLMKPDPRTHKEFTICDPACGSGGFLIAAYEWLLDTTNKGALLDRNDYKRIKKKTYFGQDLVPRPRRLALMNLYLHGIEPTIYLGDTIYEPNKGERYDCILTNPPFGTKGANQAPERSDFTIATSNKQLNFVQHVVNVLKPGGRAAMVLPDNVLFEDKAGDVFKILMEDCNLHTILRLPRGTFTPYSQGVKANVIFFQKGLATKETWIYDGRSNVPGVTKKDRPLSPAHFEEFEKCYGKDPNGKSKRTDLGEEGRFRRFTLDQIKERNYKLDIMWLKDESLENAEDLPDPQVLASEAITELEAIVDDLKDILEELETNGNGS